MSGFCSVLIIDQIVMKQVTYRNKRTFADKRQTLHRNSFLQTGPIKTNCLLHT